MAQKKSRQTFEKLKREQAVKEKRALKQERKKAAKLAKALGEPPPWQDDVENETDPDPSPQETVPEEPQRAQSSESDPSGVGPSS
jgi:hypothetical protein